MCGMQRLARELKRRGYVGSESMLLDPFSAVSIGNDWTLGGHFSGYGSDHREQQGLDWYVLTMLDHSRLMVGLPGVFEMARGSISITGPDASSSRVGGVVSLEAGCAPAGMVPSLLGLGVVMESQNDGMLNRDDDRGSIGRVVEATDAEGVSVPRGSGVESLGQRLLRGIIDIDRGDRTVEGLLRPSGADPEVPEMPLGIAAWVGDLVESADETGTLGDGLALRVAARSLNSPGRKPVGSLLDVDTSRDQTCAIVSFDREQGGGGML